MFFWKRASFGRPLLRLPDEQLTCYAALLRSPTSDPDAVFASGPNLYFT